MNKSSSKIVLQLNDITIIDVKTIIAFCEKKIDNYL